MQKKFRVWDPEVKRYVSCKNDLEDLLKHKWQGDVSKFEFEQYVGFQDVNGEDIYEGDICEVNLNDSFRITGEVSLKEGHAMCGTAILNGWMEPKITGGKY